MTLERSYFEVVGPFALPFESSGKGTSKHISAANVREFWTSEALADVRGAMGCYVFALAVGRGYTPWYVGKTTKTFEKEATTDHKLSNYNEVVFKGHKGTPVLFFVLPKHGERITPSQIDEAETYLIQTAAYKNPELKNVKKKKYPLWGIRGVVRGGKGRAGEAARKFRGMLGG